MSIKKPVHPGEVVSEILESQGWINKKDSKFFYAAKWWDKVFFIENDKILALCNGECDMDYAIAFGLSKYYPFTGISFWINLQKDYDECLEKIREDMAEIYNQACQLKANVEFEKQLRNAHNNAHNIDSENEFRRKTTAFEKISDFCRMKGIKLNRDS